MIEMRKRVILVTNSFYDTRNNKLKIGGLETYVDNLFDVLKENNHEVRIYQLEKGRGNHSYSLLEGNLVVITTKNYQKAFDKIYINENTSDSVFIICTDQLDIVSRNDNVIDIQHGIAFDIPIEYMKFSRSRSLGNIVKLLRCLKNKARAKNSKRTVCVDYNYFNWIRTIYSIDNVKKIKVIPNFSEHISKEEFKEKISKNRGEAKKILFARRFVDYRGTLLFAKVAMRIIKEFPDVKITFAGEGPLKSEIYDLFKDEKNITITSFEAKESINFHKAFDIAVVPTIYSEGTSLALCEAMASGCFPIATYVGGLSNIVIDHFNGLLSEPSEDAFYLKVKEALLMDNEKFAKIVCNAYETICMGFDKSRWANQWLNCINEI